MKRCAVFCCRGLGDGLISLVLSHNLRKQGHEVITYHPFLEKMQPLFPELPLKPFPEKEACLAFDQIFIFYEKSKEMHAILDFCQKVIPKKTCVLNPIATLKNNYPYWENGQFSGALSFAENLKNFCKHILHFKEATIDNGLVLPEGLKSGRYEKRVIIHPMSSKLDKNWTPKKFVHLAEKLEKEGFEPYFVLSDKETFPFSVQTCPAKDLVSLATWIYESKAMIGNDSGIGHLASCLGLPTVIICRHHTVSLFWKPAWGLTKVVTPPVWIPNLKGLRLRDSYWQHFIPVSSVLSAFHKLCELSNKRADRVHLREKDVISKAE